MRIGSHELDNRLFVAPMAGVTDRPLRQHGERHERLCYVARPTLH
jgi:tRNA-dihydrouridine synthase